MRHDLIETIVVLLDIFDNPVGIASVIIALILGAIMCRFAKLKTLIFCVCICLSIAVLGLVSCIVGNTPDYLWVPIFFLPFFVVITICCILKLIINIIKKRSDNN